MTIRSFANTRPQIDPSAFVDSSAVIIGDVNLSSGASVWPNATIRGDVQPIRIGAHSNIQDGAVLHVSHDCEYKPGGAVLHIGEHVTVGHLAMLHGCTIHDYCLVGMSATVMDDVVMEEYTMLGAGSLVTPGKVLAGGYLYAGSPAKQIRPLSDREKTFIRYSAEHYSKLAQRYQTDSGCI